MSKLGEQSRPLQRTRSASTRAMKTRLDRAAAAERPRSALYTLDDVLFAFERAKPIVGELTVKEVGGELRIEVRSALDQSLAAARERGHDRVAEVLAAVDMLSADEMAMLLGTTRMTVNAKRRANRLLGVEGAKRGVRYPRWQIGRDGKPFEALPALFERLGGSPWAVYRFLVQRHAELGDLTGREALARGREAAAIEAAEGVAEAFS